MRRTAKRPSLSDFARQHLATRDVSPVHAGTVLRRARKLEEFAGTADIRKVLTEENVNAFLASVLPGILPHTFKGLRGDLITLWNLAADDDLVEYPRTRRIRRVKLPALVIECFSEAEVASLVAAAEAFRGSYDGVARRLFWAALIPFAWDAGLRRGDCLAWKRETLRDDGTFRVVQNKTQQVVRRALRPSTIAAVDRINRPQPFAWPCNLWTLGQHFRLLRDVAGVNRGTFKWLRRACGSYANAAQPGCGSAVLGHSDPTMFRKHYDSGVDGNVPMPPELAEAEAIDLEAAAPHRKPVLDTAGQRAIVPSRVMRVRNRKGGVDVEPAAAASKRPEAGRLAIAAKAIRIRKPTGGAA